MHLDVNVVARRIWTNQALQHDAHASGSRVAALVEDRKITSFTIGSHGSAETPCIERVATTRDSATEAMLTLSPRISIADVWLCSVK
jgi:hypothetical protein